MYRQDERRFFDRESLVRVDMLLAPTNIFVSISKASKVLARTFHIYIYLHL